jgi:hypothetical protein
VASARLLGGIGSKIARGASSFMVPSVAQNSGRVQRLFQTALNGEQLIRSEMQCWDLSWGRFEPPTAHELAQIRPQPVRIIVMKTARLPTSARGRFKPPLCLLSIVVAVTIFGGIGLSVPSVHAQSNASRSVARTAQVPFVGCASDGQAGPIQAPKNGNVDVRVDARTAARLALYKAGIGPGVFGPRGWSCFAVYGSSGATLYLTPAPVKSADGISAKREEITGPAIQASSISGETSGRFAVAKIAARIFPVERRFVDGIISEGLLSASEFPFGPFPTDRLKYINDRVVEYTTPPRSEGLGTPEFGRLRPDNEAIRGVSIFHLPDVYLRHLAMRLPQNLNDLPPVIIKQFESAD